MKRALLAACLVLLTVFTTAHQAPRAVHNIDFSEVHDALQKCGKMEALTECELCCSGTQWQSDLQEGVCNDLCQTTHPH